MQLIYRGVAYQYNNPSYFKTMETKLLGKYRGANWQLRKLKEVPISELVLQLKYRGIAYSTGSAPDTQSA